MVVMLLLLIQVNYYSCCPRLCSGAACSCCPTWSYWTAALCPSHKLGERCVQAAQPTHIHTHTHTPQLQPDVGRGRIVMFPYRRFGKSTIELPQGGVQITRVTTPGPTRLVMAWCRHQVSPRSRCARHTPPAGAPSHPTARGQRLPTRRGRTPPSAPPLPSTATRQARPAPLQPQLWHAPWQNVSRRSLVDRPPHG